MIGFLVWNPSRSYPTRQHETFASAEAEAVRLREANPGEVFLVMAPVRGPKARDAAQALSEGLAQGRAEMREQVMRAERFSDEAQERLHDERRSQRCFHDLRIEPDEHQAIVADCLLWFDGFNAAHSHKETYERPNTPDREKLTRLNAALQRMLRGDRDLEEEIPF